MSLSINQTPTLPRFPLPDPAAGKLLLPPPRDWIVAQIPATEVVPDLPPPSPTIPTATQAAIDGLQLPVDKYPAQLKIQGGLSGTALGDISGFAQVGYYGEKIQGVLRGDIKLDIRPDGGAGTEWSLGGGLVIGLGATAKNSDVVNLQNQVGQDLGLLARNADRLAQTIGADPKLTREQKIGALEKLGNQLGGELLKGVLVAENSEAGPLSLGFTRQLALQMAPPVGTVEPFGELGVQLELLGAPNPFPTTTAAAIQNTVQALAGAENVGTATQTGIRSEVTP